ncbi:unnamed protein product, partial [Onchocerca ochengi]|uniref:Uncharacterized protein n=1 Tax=Onchocerca ochengi TaxID=42157 RepID=A0A182ET16_ONCOC
MPTRFYPGTIFGNLSEHFGRLYKISKYYFLMHFFRSYLCLINLMLRFCFLFLMFFFFRSFYCLLFLVIFIGIKMTTICLLIDKK